MTIGVPLVLDLRMDAAHDRLIAEAIQALRRIPAGGTWWAPGDLNPEPAD